MDLWLRINLTIIMGESGEGEEIMRKVDCKKRYEGLYEAFINGLTSPKELDTLTPKGIVSMFFKIFCKAS